MAFLFNRKVPLLNKNRSAEDRTAAAGNYVAEATRRRRRIPKRDSCLFNRKVLLLNKNRSAEERAAAAGWTNVCLAQSGGSMDKRVAIGRERRSVRVY